MRYHKETPGHLSTALSSQSDAVSIATEAIVCVCVCVCVCEIMGLSRLQFHSPSLIEPAICLSPQLIVAPSCPEQLEIAPCGCDETLHKESSQHHLFITSSSFLTKLLQWPKLR